MPIAAEMKTWFSHSHPTTQDLSQAWIQPAAPADAPSRTVLIAVLSALAAVALGAAAVAAYRRHQHSAEAMQAGGEFTPLQGSA